MKKSVGIMQPYLFPYLGYFQVIHLADEYVIYDDVQYIKGGWINRNNILSNGKKNLFTITLESASANKKINEIFIKDDFVKFEKSIAMIYAKAPYVHDVMALLREIIACDDKNLANFTGNSLMKIAEYLGIKTHFVYSSALQKDTTLPAQDRLLAMCDELGATDYFNAIGGKELYSKTAFGERGIDLHFVQSKLPEYKQFGGAFVPGLSIIDIMMFNSVPDIQNMLTEYVLQ